MFSQSTNGRRGGESAHRYPPFFLIVNKIGIMKKKEQSGAICGGVISLSQHMKNLKNNIWADMMAYVMPDLQYKKYIALIKQGKDKKADEIFYKYAHSQI